MNGNNAVGEPMPLLDHFHPPLFGTRHWEAFHARWAASITDALNEILPDDYFAEAQVHAGARIEVDVATFDSTSSGGGGVATAPAFSRRWPRPIWCCRRCSRRPSACG